METLLKTSKLQRSVELQNINSTALGFQSKLIRMYVGELWGLDSITPQAATA